MGWPVEQPLLIRCCSAGVTIAFPSCGQGEAAGSGRVVFSSGTSANFCTPRLLANLLHGLLHTPAVRKGPFTAGANANFHGKILYRYCRKPVYTPSNWDPALADRSSDLPMARLVLEFVYGYNGGWVQLAAGAWFVLCLRMNLNNMAAR